MPADTGPIVAWGDSLTRSTGASSAAARYPAIAANLFDPQRVVLNRGIGGQTSTQIAARQGGIPIAVTVEGNAIPALRKWHWDFSEGIGGWYPRPTTDAAALTIEGADLLIAGKGGPQGGAQCWLDVAEGLAAGTAWKVELDMSGAGSMQVGLVSTITPDGSSGAGSWVSGGSGVASSGTGVSVSGTLTAEGATTLALYIGTSTNTVRVANLAFTVGRPVAVTQKSVNVLVDSGNFSGSLPGTLAGVHGMMSTDASGNWTFVRDEEGEEIECPPGTPFIPNEAISLREHTAWIWAGRNNSGNPETVKADIAAMVAHLGHGRYLVGGILNSETEVAGSPAHAAIQTLNDDLAALYGPRFLDIRSALIAAGDPVEDAADIENDVIPASLRSDAIHLNDAGYGVVARRFFAG
jgi:hypothetical protein